jgi:RNA 2',3'-cyclic 3'-phosphodiesterase
MGANLKTKDLREVAVAQLHITLCFLGSQPVEALDALSDVVRARHPPASELALGQPLWLPPRRPGVLAIEIDDPAGSLSALQTDVAAALTELGAYEAERRRFLPHVTVARVRRGRRVRPWPLKAPAPLPFVAPSLTLYRSHPGPGASRYEALVRT